MNAYFFNVTREERENILDKHKHVYDGYVTQYAKPNEQPLYVQDFANDKNGITVNNKGEVGEYRNVRINETNLVTPPSVSVDEDIMSGAKFEPEVNIESEEMEEQLDMIGDREDDLEHGTFGDDEEDEIFDDVHDDLLDSLQEQVKKTKDMFNRIKNF